MEPERRNQTHHLLRSLVEGDAAAADELLPAVYDELRRIASRLMQGQVRGHTMQPTELIHEAWLRLARDGENPVEEGWESRVHFTRVAARAMRFVLVDHARGKLSRKRGGDRGRVTLDTGFSAVADSAERTVFVHDGLERLATIDDQLARIVELRFFGGMTTDEIAAALGTSTRTVERGWRLARAWWSKEFGDDG